MADKTAEHVATPFTTLVGKMIRTESGLEGNRQTVEQQENKLGDLDKKISNLYFRLKEETKDKHPKKVVTDNGDGTYSYFYFSPGAINMVQLRGYKEKLENIDPDTIKEVQITFGGATSKGDKFIGIYDVEAAKLGEATMLTYHNYRDDVRLPNKATPNVENDVTKIDYSVSPFLTFFDKPRIYQNK